MKRLVFLFLIGAVFAQTFVVNDTDWRCVFLAGYYAELKGQKFYAIYSPYLDLPEDAYIISCGKPIVNRYDKLYSGYIDLMFSLPEELDVSGPVLVVPESGKLALMAAPYAFRRDARIYFLNNKTLDRIAETEGKKILVEYNGKTLKGEKISVKDLFEKKSALMMSGRYLYLPANPGDPLFWTGFRGNKDVVVPGIDHNGRIYLIGPELGNLKGDYNTYVYSFVGDIRTGKTLPPPRMEMPLNRSKVSVESVFIASDGNFAIKFRNTGTLTSEVNVINIFFDCGRKEELKGSNFTISDVYIFRGRISPPTRECNVEISYIYGPDVFSMDNLGAARFQITSEPVGSPPDVNALEAVYSEGKICIRLESKTLEEVYVHGVVEVLVDGEKKMFTSGIAEVPPRSMAKLCFSGIYLRESDLLDNKSIRAIIEMGRKADRLVHAKEILIPLRKWGLKDFVEENAFLLAFIFLIAAIYFFKRSS